jgi:hypothetical protein
MTARVIRFLGRHAAVVWLLQATEGGWLVLARGHGWLHGSRDEALRDADWLARNFGFAVREPGP